jgi:predicted metalloendopeptidase
MKSSLQQVFYSLLILIMRPMTLLTGGIGMVIGVTHTFDDQGANKRGYVNVKTGTKDINYTKIINKASHRYLQQLY